MNQPNIAPGTPVATPVPNPKKKQLFIAGGIIIGIILIVEIIWARAYMKNLSQKNAPPQTDTGVRQITPSPTPKPKRLAQGRQEFSVSSRDATKGPQFSTIVIDPYDPRVGTSQTMTIAITDKLPITSVSVTVTTDKGKKTYPMKLTSGEAINGVWEGTWNVEDTHDITYTATFTARDSTNTDTVTLTIR